MKQSILTLFLIVFFLSPLYGETKKTIGIMTYVVQGMNPWDPDSIKGGITGSEEAVIYMSQKLANLGYQVIVYGHPPANSIHSLPEANPRFVNVNFDDGSTLDIAIAWRLADAAERLKKRANKVYFWPHDSSFSKLSKDQILGFDDVLWISEWQRQQWMSVNHDFEKFTKIFGNGINPEQFKPITQRENPYSCIYGSNYYNGLEILLDLWTAIKHEFPRATLDIYYGWQHWGMLTPEKEAKMRDQVAQLASLDVREHGLVGHEDLNRAYEKASLWTYPCTARETFCITALRAQLSGAIPVIINGAALSETVRHGFKCATPDEYYETLRKAMLHAKSITLGERQEMSPFILKEYTWEAIAIKWKQLFDADLKTSSVPEPVAVSQPH